VAYPDDLAEKLKKAREIRGMKFIHIFAPCPTGWKSSPGMTVELARLAVQTRLFPLVEVWDGRYYKLNKDIPQKPVADYLTQQGRFGKLTKAETKAFETAIDEKWEDILLKETLGGPPPGNA
jgi:pyruvate/2-oxoacid:ferredoxin oxidoreductase beta subunit